MRKDELWSDKTKRDNRAKELKAMGKSDVRRCSHLGSLLHPQYVEDLKDTPNGRNTGLGSAVYKTFFEVLYEVSWEERVDESAPEEPKPKYIRSDKWPYVSRLKD